MARKTKATKKQQEEIPTSSSDDENIDNDSGESDAVDDEHQMNDDDDGSDGSGSGSDQEEQSNDNDEESGSENGDDEQSDGEEDDADEENDNNVAIDETNRNPESCTFALSDLVSFNTHQINPAQLYSSKPSSSLNKYYTSSCIPSQYTINEDVLMSKAVGGTKELLKELWRLPSEKKEGGFVMALLGGSEGRKLVLPRALPPPPQKQLTKWEKFALERGISPKSKRSRKQFDEATGTWKHLTGSTSTKANAGPESWPILEVKKNQDPNVDPWEVLRQEKKSRVDKNTVNRMKNAESAGLLERGSANRMAKQIKKNKEVMEKQRELSRRQEEKQGLVAPVGVPVDMSDRKLRGKPSIQLALKATQVSTASLGKFDKMREGEPERKILDKTKKRKLLVDSGEEKKARDILTKVMNGSKEKERDVKKGKYAKGETGYDYDFDDGLGAGSFRKKKGRAGVGKMRKITKKRIK